MSHPDKDRVPSTKTFKGEMFRYAGARKLKSDAQKKADEMREKGWSVRTVKSIDKYRGVRYINYRA